MEYKQDALIRPDNAPISLILDSGSQFAFVTLHRSALFIIDVVATPMRIVAESDKNVVHPNGSVGIEAPGKLYVNSGGGSAANPYESDLYSSAGVGSPEPALPNLPLPNLVFSRDSLGVADSHGGVLTKGSRYLWVADRAANLITVVDTVTDLVVNEFSIVSASSADPTPDLMGISPNGNRAYATLRGPNPLTGNFPGVNNAKGSTPGPGISRVTDLAGTGVWKRSRLCHTWSTVSSARIPMELGCAQNNERLARGRIAFPQRSRAY